MVGYNLLCSHLFVACRLLQYASCTCVKFLFYGKNMYNSSKILVPCLGCNKIISFARSTAYTSQCFNSLSLTNREEKLIVFLLSRLLIVAALKYILIHTIIVLLVIFCALLAFYFKTYSATINNHFDCFTERSRFLARFMCINYQIKNRYLISVALHSCFV